ncbi:uncharacterized protein K02A2.6-like [Aphis gossypii]|uniref:uncharacterized protein K02A2.6-like n=1 Tax=Aphis gossypii TaxID=80765 RepID=UPI0021593DBD|nr:uncharacterized protein K02A2.6-like [Aphis gossypii]
MSSLANPLYALLKANVKFYWGPEQERAFVGIKKQLLSKTILTHYDTTLELVLACDASPKGIGAVLSHKFPNKVEKPIAFASRTLSKSEQGYSQLDKEALALVYGVKYFHQYLYGRSFILKTDHKPLISIFGEKKVIPVMAAHRLQRYAIFLEGYSYTIEFVKGEDNGNADSLSRLPLEGVDMINHEFCNNFYINLITTNVQAITDLDIIEEIQRDVVLRKVFLLVMSGKWPSSNKEVVEEIRPYFNRRNELAIEQGMLLWGHRLVIPLKFRKVLLSELHSSHLGTVKMKSIARSYLWWPNIDKEIVQITKECLGCMEHSDNPPKSILHNWPWPEGPAQRVHLDFLGPINGKMFVVIIDAHSKWVHVRFMNNITSEGTIKILREYFSLWGIPAKLVTDNGPSLVSEVMEEFLAKNGVFHVKTPPYNPASNGAAENLVRTFKNFLKKSGLKSDLDTEIARFMLSYNSTKHCATGLTPAELHIGRRLFTSLDRLVPRAKYKYDKSIVAAKRSYKGSRVKQFEIKDTVMCRNYASGAKWLRGTIIKILSPVTYLVQMASGDVWKRHINQLLDTGGVETNFGVRHLTKPVLGLKDGFPSLAAREVESGVSLVRDSQENEQQEGPKLWRSDRVRKMPNRLNL